MIKKCNKQSYQNSFLQKQLRALEKDGYQKPQVNNTINTTEIGVEQNTKQF